MRDRTKEIFEDIPHTHDLFIETLEIAEAIVHLFLMFTLRYNNISKVLGMLESISGRVIFKVHHEIKKGLWGREFWEDGYFIRTVDNKVTAEAIEHYIKYHREQEESPTQLELSQGACPVNRVSRSQLFQRSMVNT